MKHLVTASMLTTLVTLATPALGAADWCQEDHWGNGRKARHCELRESTLDLSRGRISVDARPNGGVEVVAWDRSEIRLVAKVVAQAQDESGAKALAGQVQIVTQGEIRAEGPSSTREQSWSVSYRLQVPARSDLRLQSTNGGLHVEGIDGQMDLSTTNGGLHLSNLSGEVKGHTTNGGIHVEASGSEWKGAGLDLSTTNGGVHLTLPRGFNARLEAATANGGLDVDFPVKVEGVRRNQIRADLGKGGAPIHLSTTNGGVQVDAK